MKLCQYMPNRHSRDSVRNHIGIFTAVFSSTRKRSKEKRKLHSSYEFTIDFSERTDAEDRSYRRCYLAPPVRKDCCWTSTGSSISTISWSAATEWRQRLVRTLLGFPWRTRRCQVVFSLQRHPGLNLGRSTPPNRAAWTARHALSAPISVPHWLILQSMTWQLHTRW